ncbi:phage tail tape measure protein, lambda family [Pseudorhodobacter antarcticus]|jgi:phage-related minor tail protein|uniref:Phage tail tape measure protein, lambda family n=1 Tax=Pseudorhodobacter antarcticus TaxID=1077947 RepID=A0A1H8DBA9_9RHOB|nr:phage tail tape measure protein [Pseudorhodobacter antarcticus]SEN03767.1 phage tail tape measure protein, lambda family [Pseudorhodobacter antarcticus]
MADIERLEDQIAALEVSLEGTGGMVAAFDGELGRMRESLVFTGREVTTLSNSMGGGLRRAFDGVVFDGMKLSDALKGVAKTMSDSVYSVAMKPVQNALGGLVANGLGSVLGGVMPFANGGAFSQGRVMPFAKGGVVSQPTNFPMRGGMGLMGEAGPEAIMPLARGADGRLGVQAGGGGRPVTVVMNISTPDVAGFQRSQSQIAALASRALSRGQRNK